jgi:hypothetical protein
VEFISDRMSYVILRGRWCNIIVLKVHAPNVKIRHVFYQFPRYDTNILLGNFNVKVGRENFFKLTNRNKSLHEISNDIGVRVVNFGTSKNLVVKISMFLHCRIHKYTWTSRVGNTRNQIHHVLIDRRWH